MGDKKSDKKSDKKTGKKPKIHSDQSIIMTYIISMVVLFVCAMCVGYFIITG